MSKCRPALFIGIRNVFENIFSKPNSTAAAAAPSEKTSGSSTADAHAAAPVSAEETQAWHAKIHAAAADDAVLLQLMRDAPGVPLKLAALQALTQEETLRQAMHDFREQDKRIYRAAKSRWERATATRTTAAEVASLIATARTLLDQDSAPVNRVVELDRAWAALDADLIEPAQVSEFATVSEQLGAKVRARGEHVQTLTRWLGAADSAMQNMNVLLPGVAQGSLPPDDLETLAVNLLELTQGIPDAGDARCVEKVDAANRLLALASSVVEHAKFLHTLPAPGSVGEADEKQFIETWRAFPEMSEGELHAVLASRFAGWRNAETQQRQIEHDTQTAEQRARRAEQNKQRVSAIERDVEAAEAAHAAGHVGELTRLLAVVYQALKRGPVHAALNGRIEVLRAEQRRLHDWQRWSGAQGREQLVTEAQALAQAATGKINLKAHTDAINKLRERWKELDKLAGASNQAVWLAFDGALETAYVPIAAQLEKLKTVRIENLAAREAIITSLGEAATKFFPALQVDAAPISSATPDWRALAHTLEQAQAAWRKLGPVEHTVPRKSLQGDRAVTTRYATAVQTLDAPLKKQYAAARAQREQLIAAAKAIAASDAAARDVVDKMRKLQTQWQAVAKSLPVPRRDENALWAAFKAATDSIFAARDASRAAAEAAANAQQQARLDVIERVAALSQATSAADIKRGLSDTDSAWRAAPDAPRPQAAKLDARYRAAREAASKHIAELATHAAQARYDALIAAMALFHERETLHDAGNFTEEQTAALQARWTALEYLPHAWKTRLEPRFQGNGAAATVPGTKSGKNFPETLSDTLLNLEVACGIDSPAEFLAARQQLKIRALKNAMEARQTTVTTPADIERWLLDAAATPRPDAVSSERLEKIIAAVRRRSPSPSR